MAKLLLEGRAHGDLTQGTDEHHLGVESRRRQEDVAAERHAHRPRGPMDKASAYGAGDCRFESCRGHSSCTPRRHRWPQVVPGHVDNKNDDADGIIPGHTFASDVHQTQGCSGN